MKNEGSVFIENAHGRLEEVFHDPPEQQWDALVADWLGWIEGGPEPRVGFSTMLKTSELNFAAYLSALRGGPG